jgi:hypothetical protein
MTATAIVMGTMAFPFIYLLIAAEPMDGLITATTVIIRRHRPIAVNARVQ